MKRKRPDENRVWCNVCKIWLANNRAQREQHQAGSKHRTAQAQLIKDIANRNEERRKEDVAANAMEADRNQSKTSGYQLLEQAMRETAKSTHISQNEHHNDTAFFHNTRSAHFHESATDILHSAEVQKEWTPNVNEDLQLPQSAATDDSGYPLSVNEVYGTWKTCETQEEDEHQTNTTEDDMPLHQPIDTTEGVHHSPLNVNEAESQSLHSKLCGPSDVEPKKELSISFKKKLAPRSRRIKN